MGILIDSCLLIHFERNETDVSSYVQGRDEEDIFLSVVSASELLGLTGGIEAAKQALVAADMQASDIDLFEFNEAFASTSIKFPRDLDVDPETVNVNGGAIALGHAMGATGATLLGTLLDEMERRDLATGLVAISGAAGIGTATIIERH